MGADYLEYCIRETRQQWVSRRAEQQPEMLDHLKCSLAQALNSGQTIALPPLVWHLAATETKDLLEACLWYGMSDGPPHLIVHVSSGDPPRCEASREGLRQSTNWVPAVLDAGDLELGFAWAWLESRPQDPILRARINP